MQADNKTPLWIEVAGWIGVFLIFTAYFLLSIQWTGPGYAYQSMNIAGAVGVGLAAYAKRNHQSVVLQIVWIAIALMAIVRLALKG